MKITAFRTGVFAGVVLFATAALAIYLMARDPSPPRYHFEASTTGTDLSRHGAHTVEIRTTYGSLMKQTCNGACDDLVYKYKAHGENGVGIEVRDRAGRCLSCDGGAYVDSSSHLVATIHVGGVDKLAAKGGYVERRADGSVKPFRATGEASPKTTP